MQTVRKAFAYITREGQLLVFDHPDHPDAGTQVPKGTMEPDETAEQAVMREAEEETGLTDLRLVRFLGNVSFDLAVYGKSSVEQRYFFHLECTTQPPDSWYHYEEHPSEGLEDRIRFFLYWVDLSAAKQLLSIAHGHGAFLDQLAESLNP